MYSDLLRSLVFAAVAAAVALAAVPLASAFAAGIGAGATTGTEARHVSAIELVGKPSILNKEMDFVLRDGRPENRTVGPRSSAQEEEVPTSMLWPAPKYLPQLKSSLRA